MTQEKYREAIRVLDDALVSDRASKWGIASHDGNALDVSDWYIGMVASAAVALRGQVPVLVMQSGNFGPSAWEYEVVAQVFSNDSLVVLSATRTGRETSPVRRVSVQALSSVVRVELEATPLPNVGDRDTPWPGVRAAVFHFDDGTSVTLSPKGPNSGDRVELAEYVMRRIALLG